MDKACPGHVQHRVRLCYFLILRFCGEKKANPNTEMLIPYTSRDPVTRGQEKVFLKLIPHAKEKVW